MVSGACASRSSLDGSEHTSGNCAAHAAGHRKNSPRQHNSTRNYISRIETERQEPGLFVIMRVARALSTTAAALLEKTTTMTPALLGPRVDGGVLQAPILIPHVSCAEDGNRARQQLLAYLHDGACDGLIARGRKCRLR